MSQRRGQLWTPRDWGFLVCLILLAVGTIIALTRQQSNFDEHRHINAESCRLNVEVRVLIADGFSTVADNPLIDDQTRAELMRLTERADILRDQTAKTCRETE